MRRVIAALAGLGAGSVLLALTPATSSSVATTISPPGVVSPTSPITHVVIIYQENHTFDDVLGPVCQTRATPCDGYIGPVTFADGITADNVVQPDKIPVVAHTPRAQRLGMRNEWDRIYGCQDPPYLCVSHVDPANIANLTRLANAYTVSDATYATGDATSFGAHVTLGAGTLDGFIGTNPVDSKRGAPPHYGWGCPSNKDAQWGRRSNPSFQPTCIPTKKGRGPYRHSKVPYTPTILERMEQADLSWHIYEGDSQTKPTLGIWSICTYFQWCWGHRWDLEHDSSRADFVDAAGAGKLPNLSILIPTTGGVSQHNFTSMTVGDNYLGQMVGAVMNGPDWDSTAIFITYDDCGCFYDHVQPPDDLGIRNPMVIISPYAKAGGTDSHTAIQPYSMLTFAQHVFGLKPLTDAVSNAYDYADSFDFSQQPLSGVPMTHKAIPQAERRRLAKLLPLVLNDPT